MDLSNVKAVLNGSEPISAATVRRFNEAFDPYGFKPEGDQARPTGWPRPRCSCRPRRPTSRRRSSTSTATQLNASPLRRGRRRMRRRPSRRRRRARSASPSGPPSSMPRLGHRAARRADRRDLDQRPEHGHRLLGQAGGDHRDVPEHPQVADQPVARRGRDRRRHLGAHRRLRRLPRRRALHHRPRQGSGDHRRPQPLPAGPGVLRAGGQQARCAPASSRRSRCLPTSCPTRCSRTRTPA